MELPLEVLILVTLIPNDFSEYPSLLVDNAVLFYFTDIGPFYILMYLLFRRSPPSLNIFTWREVLYFLTKGALDDTDSKINNINT